MLKRGGENGPLIILLVGMQIGAILWKRVWRLLRTLKIELPLIQQSYSWASLQRKHDLKRYLYSHVHCSTRYNTQAMQTT